jgi:hypothetical protein
MSPDPNINLKVMTFRKKLAEDQLHFLMFESIDKLYDEANLASIEEVLKPKPANGDDDIESDLANMSDEDNGTPPFPEM